MTKAYSFIKGLGKSLLQAAVFGFPVMIKYTPDAWKALTVGTILSMIANYLKIKWQESEPITS